MKNAAELGYTPAPLYYALYDQDKGVWLGNGLWSKDDPGRAERHTKAPLVRETDPLPEDAPASARRLLVTPDVTLGSVRYASKTALTNAMIPVW